MKKTQAKISRVRDVSAKNRSTIKVVRHSVPSDSKQFKAATNIAGDKTSALPTYIPEAERKEIEDGEKKALALNALRFAKRQVHRSRSTVSQPDSERQRKPAGDPAHLESQYLVKLKDDITKVEEKLTKVEKSLNRAKKGGGGGEESGTGGQSENLGASKAYNVHDYIEEMNPPPGFHSGVQDSYVAQLSRRLQLPSRSLTNLRYLQTAAEAAAVADPRGTISNIRQELDEWRRAHDLAPLDYPTTPQSSGPISAESLQPFYTTSGNFLLNILFKDTS